MHPVKEEKMRDFVPVWRFYWGEANAVLKALVIASCGR